MAAKKSGKKQKQIKGLIKLEIGAGSANPAPPVGPALGQQGLNIMEFCKAFNDATKDMEKGQPVPVLITAYEDKSFIFETKTPPASFLLRKALGITKGSGEPNKTKVGKVTEKQLREIAEIKMKDLSAHNIEMAMKTIAGSARSMGIEVE